MLFIDNKYTHTYYKIIERSKLRIIPYYTEKHHIIPKSLGGSNKKDNLALLTAREHFICHLLLTKMTSGTDRSKMVLSVFYLTGRGKGKRDNIIKNSHLYEILKKDLSKIVSNQHKGRKRPPRSNEYKEKMKMSKRGKNAWNWLGFYHTPWGIYESAMQASKSCPEYITANYIRSLCIRKNKEPINYLSVCRSKGYLKLEHVGKTPNQLGFGINNIL
jgi:hypothetical protein